MLLAALSLAHELEEERRQRRELEQRSREMLRALLARIDAALESDGEEPAAGEAHPEESPEP